MLIRVDLGGWVRGTRPTAKQNGSKSGCDRCMSLQNGRKNMFKKLVTGGIALAVALSANLTTAFAEDGLYIPILSYRTGPFAGGGVPTANGFASVEFEGQLIVRSLHSFGSSIHATKLF